MLHLCNCPALLLGILAIAGALSAQTIVEQGHSKVVSLNASGKLIYAKDSKGNRLPDFSHVGYHSCEKAIPDVPVRVTLEPEAGDDTQRIQAALDRLGTFEPDESGHRGALLLKRGVYWVGGTLKIRVSGIVLRGEGNGRNDTVIVATGHGDKKYRRALIRVAPASHHANLHSYKGDLRMSHIKLLAATKQRVTDDYVSIGSQSFSVESASGFKTGDRIVVHRASTQDWLHLLGCDQLKPKWSKVINVRWEKDGDHSGFYFERPASSSKYRILQAEGESWSDFVARVPLAADGKTMDVTRQWAAGDFDFHFERKIVSIDGNRITIDAPIMQSMDKRYGGGAIFHYEAPDRLTEVGIEHLRMVSEFADPTPDHPYGDPAEADQAESHAWYGIQLVKNTENTWVRNVSANYFGYSLVSVSGKNATIQDCVSLGHASRITGGRRYPFMVNGQLNLVQRCVAHKGRHEFVTTGRTLGPNVFVDCLGVDSQALHGSGPHSRYTVGALFDNVIAESQMESEFYGNRGTGHGWGGAQICFYNCTAPEFAVKAPPGEICWVLGSAPEGTQGSRLMPRSIYYQQVLERLGKEALSHLMTDAQLEKMGQ
jgi:hypothetical protein